MNPRGSGRAQRAAEIQGGLVRLLRNKSGASTFALFVLRLASSPDSRRRFCFYFLCVRLKTGLWANVCRFPAESMNAQFATGLLILFLCSSNLRAPAETPTPRPESPRPADPNALSPDKKWEYRPPDEDTPKIVKAGTNDVAGDLDACGVGSCGEPKVFWAPDSKHLALYWGQGRTHQTDIYELNGDKWKALKEPGDEDEILAAADELVASQLKKKGLPKKTELRFISWTVEPDRWVDADRLVIVASMGQLLQSKDLGFGGSIRFTLKFEGAGDWKIIDRHRMSENEEQQFDHSHDL